MSKRRFLKPRNEPDRQLSADDLMVAINIGQQRQRAWTVNAVMPLYSLGSHAMAVIGYVSAIGFVPAAHRKAMIAGRDTELQQILEAFNEAFTSIEVAGQMLDDSQRNYLELMIASYIQGIRTVLRGANRPSDCDDLLNCIDDFPADSLFVGLRTSQRDIQRGRTKDAHIKLLMQLCSAISVDSDRPQWKETTLAIYSRLRDMQRTKGSPEDMLFGQLSVYGPPDTDNDALQAACEWVRRTYNRNRA